jgi:putative tryptophan/tyrosine transport system substrate-binding protein
MQLDRLKRREFITLLGGAAAAWPLAARAQQSAMPVIGYLGVFAPTGLQITSIRKGLAEFGYVERRNVAIDYVHPDVQNPDGRFERLTALATEFVNRQVALIFAQSTPLALAAKAATTAIPIVFNIPDDPVKLGLVSSLARPGGNATGMNFLLGDLGAKQFGLLRELVPKAVRVGLLINSHGPNADAVTKDMKAAASAIAVELVIVEASDSREIETAFSTLASKRVDALVVGPDSLFFGRRVQITTLATRYGLPTIYNTRDYAEAGGLMTYGTSLIEAYRQAGAYAGRILKGEKPADLPVVQSSKFEFIINLATARALGVTVPPSLLATADEVIE